MAEPWTLNKLVATMAALAKERPIFQTDFTLPLWNICTSVSLESEVREAETHSLLAHLVASCQPR